MYENLVESEGHGSTWGPGVEWTTGTDMASYEPDGSDAPLDPVPGDTAHELAPEAPPGATDFPPPPPPDTPHGQASGEVPDDDDGPGFDWGQSSLRGGLSAEELQQLEEEQWSMDPRLSRDHYGALLRSGVEVRDGRDGKPVHVNKEHPNPALVEEMVEALENRSALSWPGTVVLGMHHVHDRPQNIVAQHTPPNDGRVVARVVSHADNALNPAVAEMVKGNHINRILASDAGQAIAEANGATTIRLLAPLATKEIITGDNRLFATIIETPGTPLSGTDRAERASADVQELLIRNGIVPSFLLAYHISRNGDQLHIEGVGHFDELHPAPTNFAVGEWRGQGSTGWGRMTLSERAVDDRYSVRGGIAVVGRVNDDSAPTVLEADIDHGMAITFWNSTNGLRGLLHLDTEDLEWARSRAVRLLDEVPGLEHPATFVHLFADTRSDKEQAVGMPQANSMLPLERARNIILERGQVRCVRQATAAGPQRVRFNTHTGDIEVINLTGTSEPYTYTPPPLVQGEQDGRS